MYVHKLKTVIVHHAPIGQTTKRALCCIAGKYNPTAAVQTGYNFLSVAFTKHAKRQCTRLPSAQFVLLWTVEINISIKVCIYTCGCATLCLARAVCCFDGPESIPPPWRLYKRECVPPYTACGWCAQWVKHSLLCVCCSRCYLWGVA